MKLSRKNFERVHSNIKEIGRKLERVRFEYLFLEGDKQNVVDELEKYRNEDGGFGHALEPDFRMPISSPMATSVAFQILEEIDCSYCNNIIENAIKYLENSYNSKEGRWYAVSWEINEYPHAPWWGFSNEDRMTMIDYSWGNPTAEILGYLLKYKKYVGKLDLNKIVDRAIDHFIKKDNYKSEHEVFCYQKLYNYLDIDRQKRIKPSIILAIKELMNTNESEWENYVPYPLTFLKSSCDNWEISDDLIQKNIKYMIEILEKDGAIYPNWDWKDNYPDTWEISKKEWTGILTLDILKILERFNKIKNRKGIQKRVIV